MNRELLKETVVVFYDEAENFKSDSTQLKLGKRLFKEVINLHSTDEFAAVLERYEDMNQQFLFFVHLFHQNKQGYYQFRDSDFQEKYPNLDIHYISSAPKQTIDILGESVSVHSYDNYHDKIGPIFRPQSKGVILGVKFKAEPMLQAEQDVTARQLYPQVDYALITAMYEDEFQEVEKLIDWHENDAVVTDTKIYRIGHLKGRPDKKIVTAVQSATGMVDASIIATQMMEFFRPAYLFMCGVCGARKGIELGDIVIAKKVFTFQKGKLSDLRDGNNEKIELFNSSGEKVDYHHLYDANHNQIQVLVEKFERDIDSMIEIDDVLKDKLDPKLKGIQDRINNELEPFGKPKLTIRFEPMACSSMIINKEGYFEDNINAVDRRTVAVEMESYGVARATKFANNGQTKFLIIKSVMDNTMLKDDKAKKFAAWSSATTLKHILFDGII